MVGVRPFRASSMRSLASARAVPWVVVLLTADFAVLSSVNAQVAMAPEWLTVTKDLGTSSVSAMKSLTSLVGIHEDPSLALMSPGRRSAGWMAFSASTLRWYERSMAAAASAVWSFARTLPLR